MNKYSTALTWVKTVGGKQEIVTILKAGIQAEDEEQAIGYAITQDNKFNRGFYLLSFSVKEHTPDMEIIKVGEESEDVFGMMKDKIKALLVFAETDGAIINGGLTREIILDLKAMTDFFY